MASPAAASGVAASMPSTAAGASLLAGAREESQAAAAMTATSRTSVRTRGPYTCCPGRCNVDVCAGAVRVPCYPIWVNGSRARLLLGTLLVLPLLVQLPALVTGQIYWFQDLGGAYFPTEHLLERTGATGWNPHILLGMPLLGDPQTAPYEPVRAIARAAGIAAETALPLYFACYLAIATLGTWLLARRKQASALGAALAVLVYVWGSVLVLRFRHPWVIPALAMVPWIALATDRLCAARRLVDAVAIAVLVAWAALGGHPQPPYMDWLFVAGYAAAHVATTVPRGERLRAVLAIGWRLAVAAALFVGLIAAWYAPVVDLLGRSTRHGAGIAFAGAYSWNPWDWLRLLSPDIYGNDLAGTHFGTRNYHEQTIYLGVAPLLLVLVAARPSRRVALVWVAAGAFLLAAGSYSPAWYACYFAVPGFKLFRAPVRYAAFFVLAMAVLAGLAVTRMARAASFAGDAARVARRMRRVWVGIVAVFAVAAVAAWPWIDGYTRARRARDDALGGDQDVHLRRSCRRAARALAARSHPERARCSTRRRAHRARSRRAVAAVRSDRAGGRRVPRPRGGPRASPPPRRAAYSSTSIARTASPRSFRWSTGARRPASTKSAATTRRSTATCSRCSPRATSPPPIAASSTRSRHATRPTGCSTCSA